MEARIETISQSDFLSLSNEDQQRTIEMFSHLYWSHAPNDSPEEIRKRLFGYTGSTVDWLSCGSRAVGFSVSVPKRLNCEAECLWKHGVVIDPEFHSKGFYKELLLRAVSRNRTPWLATMTRNPRVYESWFKLFGEKLNPFPNTIPDPKVSHIASDLVADDPDLNLKNFNPRTMVVKNVYASAGPDAVLRKSREMWVEEFFRNRLDPRTDTMILVVGTASL